MCPIYTISLTVYTFVSPRLFVVKCRTTKICNHYIVFSFLVFCMILTHNLLEEYLKTEGKIINKWKIEEDYTIKKWCIKEQRTWGFATNRCVYTSSALWDRLSRKVNQNKKSKKNFRFQGADRWDSTTVRSIWTTRKTAKKLERMKEEKKIFQECNSYPQARTQTLPD